MFEGQTCSLLRAFTTEMTDREIYEQQIAPRIWQLAEKTQAYRFLYLIAIQVGGQVQISGDLIDASHCISEAFAVLFLKDDIPTEPIGDLSLVFDLSERGVYTSLRFVS